MDLKLDLTLKEAQALKIALNSFNSQSQQEVVRTDSFELRNELRGMLAQLKIVEARIEALLKSSGNQAA